MTNTAPNLSNWVFSWVRTPFETQKIYTKNARLLQDHPYLDLAQVHLSAVCFRSSGPQLVKTEGKTGGRPTVSTRLVVSKRPYSQQEMGLAKENDPSHLADRTPLRRVLMASRTQNPVLQKCPELFRVSGSLYACIPVPMLAAGSAASHDQCEQPRSCGLRKKPVIYSRLVERPASTAWFEPTTSNAQ